MVLFSLAEAISDYLLGYIFALAITIYIVAVILQLKELLQLLQNIQFLSQNR